MDRGQYRHGHRDGRYDSDRIRDGSLRHLHPGVHRNWDDNYGKYVDRQRHYYKGVPMYRKRDMDSQHAAALKRKRVLDNPLIAIGFLPTVAVYQYPCPCQGILEVRTSKGDAHVVNLLPHK